MVVLLLVERLQKVLYQYCLLAIWYFVKIIFKVFFSWKKNIKDCSKVRNNEACKNLLLKNWINLLILSISLHFFCFYLKIFLSWIPKWKLFDFICVILELNRLWNSSIGIVATLSGIWKLLDCNQISLYSSIL